MIKNIDFKFLTILILIVYIITNNTFFRLKENRVYKKEIKRLEVVNDSLKYLFKENQKLISEIKSDIQKKNKTINYKRKKNEVKINNVDGVVLDSIQSIIANAKFE